jgi:hypothetical protein
LFISFEKEAKQLFEGLEILTIYKSVRHLIFGILTKKCKNWSEIQVLKNFQVILKKEIIITYFKTRSKMWSACQYFLLIYFTVIFIFNTDSNDYNFQALFCLANFFLKRSQIHKGVCSYEMCSF